VGRAATAVAVIYAIGLALTFDEFGMWVHLGGSYWQRASFDAVTVVAGILASIAFLPPPRQLKPKHAVTAVVVLIAAVIFTRLLLETLQSAEKRVAPALQRIEAESPQ
jgi:hypothetical protein